MPTGGWKRIKSRKLKLPINVQRDALALMEEFQREGVSRASKYPRQIASLPKFSEKTGKRLNRKRYKRTLSLARSWRQESTVVVRKGKIEGRVISSPTIAPYNIHVIGPKDGPPKKRQTPEMTRRKWPDAPELLENLFEDNYRQRFIDLTQKRE
jgi:hypothetical protein